MRSAGVKAADLMKTIGAAEDGSGALKISELDQLLANGNLQTVHDASIYALGDCAAYQQPDGTWVPPPWAGCQFFHLGAVGQNHVLGSAQAAPAGARGYAQNSVDLAFRND